MAGDGEALSSSLSEGMYHAFFSFRGEDIRYLFTDHLYHRLAKMEKLKVFRDEPGLEMSDQIKATLMEAIKRSRMLIVVMSENYVSPSWCLMELEEMLNEKSKESIKDHERRVGVDKVKAWKSALSALCRLSGQHIVVKKGVESLLSLESRNTLGMVAIYEEDTKIDITTFAFALYYKIKREFQEANFLLDVSRKLRENDNGLGNMQKELLSDMDSTSSGSSETIKQMLQHKRVLFLVLDGVDTRAFRIAGRKRCLVWSSSRIS
ncbi:hypothetical protein PIB30_039697 [Stylosanthes scabra]|uniref:TIR domain-containing protein n=1 Tax=Stylosanthes scabra TaxID=79078 RepID=A0ABU6XDJ3_9FABA|nr:hypothetical protein [Stylosanthes scabra]